VGAIERLIKPKAKKSRRHIFFFFSLRWLLIFSIQSRRILKMDQFVVVLFLDDINVLITLCVVWSRPSPTIISAFHISSTKLNPVPSYSISRARALAGLFLSLALSLSTAIWSILNVRLIAIKFWLEFHFLSSFRMLTRASAASRCSPPVAVVVESTDRRRRSTLTSPQEHDLLDDNNNSKEICSSSQAKPLKKRWLAHHTVDEAEQRKHTIENHSSNIEGKKVQL
jgi:hypothetical protein